MAVNKRTTIMERKFDKTQTPNMHSNCSFSFKIQWTIIQWAMHLRYEFFVKNCPLYWGVRRQCCCTLLSLCCLCHLQVPNSKLRVRSKQLQPTELACYLPQPRENLYLRPAYQPLFSPTTFPHHVSTLQSPSCAK